jgi:hypothetical protein
MKTAAILGWHAPSVKASNVSFSFKFLEQQPQVDRATISLLRDLNSIRNQAAHSPDYAITKDAALEYSATCARLVSYFDFIATDHARAVNPSR